LSGTNSAADSQIRVIAGTGTRKSPADSFRARMSERADSRKLTHPCPSEEGISPVITNSPLGRGRGGFKHNK